MPVPPRTSSGKKQSQSSEAVPALERTAAARIAALLSPKSAKGRGMLQVVDPKGQCLELPTTLTVVMYRAAELLAKGRPVAVLPEEEMLSTQEAADLLNVSRQYLVRLVDAGGEWTDFAPQQITVVSLMGMLYLALIGSVIGNTAYLWLLDRISAPIVATYTFINPLVAVILGVWVLGERITTPSLGGAALVIGSVAALLYVSNTDKPATRSSAKAHSR
jgi:uncharacterized membrane protein